MSLFTFLTTRLPKFGLTQHSCVPCIKDIWFSSCGTRFSQNLNEQRKKIQMRAKSRRPTLFAGGKKRRAEPSALVSWRKKKLRAVLLFLSFTFFCSLFKMGPLESILQNSL